LQKSNGKVQFLVPAILVYIHSRRQIPRIFSEGKLMLRNTTFGLAKHPVFLWGYNPTTNDYRTFTSAEKSIIVFNRIIP